jgi:uncharacterized protein (DUF305 family)
MKRTDLPCAVVTLLAILGAGCICASPALSAVPQCVSVTVQPDVQQIAESMRQMSSDAAELSFMQTMIRLDMGAIGMSEQAVSRVMHPELRRFAQRVMNKRSTEQGKFLSWILTLYGDGAYSASKPIWADSDAVRRFDLCNCDFEVGYMLAMIRHDAGGLAIASEARARSAHGRIEQAASGVMTGRCADIAQLQNWLACWYGISVSVVGPGQCIQC